MTELVFRADAYARECAAIVTGAEPSGIRLDRSVFYPTGGGQPGDTGHLVLADGREIAIVDTVKGASPDDVVHVPAPGAALPAVGAVLTARIDWARRYRLMRVHSCLHLLSAVVQGAVTGGSVGEGRGRLDFDIPDPTLDKDHITAALNRLIAEDHPVRPRQVSTEELLAQPDLVKTMSVKPPLDQGMVRLIEVGGVDLQACGGTHVMATHEIGKVICAKIEKKGRMNRRVIIELVD